MFNCISGSGLKVLIKMVDVVAIITQVAGIAVPIGVHAMELGEYKWLVSDEPRVRSFIFCKRDTVQLHDLHYNTV